MPISASNPLTIVIFLLLVPFALVLLGLWTTGALMAWQDWRRRHRRHRRHRRG